MSARERTVRRMARDYQRGYRPFRRIRLARAFARFTMRWVYDGGGPSRLELAA